MCKVTISYGSMHNIAKSKVTKPNDNGIFFEPCTIRERIGPCSEWLL